MRLYLFARTVSSRPDPAGLMVPNTPNTPITPTALTWARPLGGTPPDSLSVPSRPPCSSHPISSARSVHRTRRCTGESSRLDLGAVSGQEGGGWCRLRGCSVRRWLRPKTRGTWVGRRCGLLLRDFRHLNRKSAVVSCLRLFRTCVREELTAANHEVILFAYSHDGSPSARGPRSVLPSVQCRGPTPSPKSPHIPVHNHRRLLHHAVRADDDWRTQCEYRRFRVHDTPRPEGDVPAEVRVLRDQRGGMRGDLGGSARGESVDSVDSV